MFDIITIGSATRDVFLITSSLHPHRSREIKTIIEVCLPFGTKIDVQDVFFDTGGSSTNTAVSFIRLLGKTAAIFRVGDDESGQAIFKVLKKEGVEFKFAQVDRSVKTAYSVILSTPTGQRTILVSRGASSLIQAKQIPFSKIKTRWVYCGSLAGNISLWRRIVAFVKKNKINFASNIGSGELTKSKSFQPLVKNMDIFVLNREEAGQLYGISPKNLKKILQTLQGKAKFFTALTDGPKGAYVITPKNIWYAPSIPVKVLNVTGAGDAAASGIVAGYDKWKDPVRALQLGILNATSVIQKMGAKGGILSRLPTLKELKRVIIKKYKI